MKLHFVAKMDGFQQNLIKLKDGVKISDFLGEGATFDIEPNEEDTYYDASSEIDFTNFENSEEHLIPFDIPFTELKSKMEVVADGVWKKVYKEAKKHAELVDFAKHRVTYHRNLYMETESHPFDSTWLNGKPDKISPNETYKILEGILDAMSTMKEGEQSYFVISYRKMFKEKGCEPRVSPYADIFCDIKIMKLEEIGDQANVDELENKNYKKSFASAKEIYNDGRLRAKNLFENKKIDAAVKMYEKIWQMLEFCKTDNEDEIRERKEMMIQNFINLGTCYNVREDPNKTMSMIRQIEGLCDINELPKVLFIKGKALRLIGEYKEAAKSLKRANQLAPNNATIAKELQYLDTCISNYNNISKKFAEKLLI